MITDTWLAAKVGHEAGDDTSNGDTAESTAQVQPACQVARSQACKCQSCVEWAKAPHTYAHAVVFRPAATPVDNT